MLPNRFSITRKAEERLRREKNITGMSPNISARALFWTSIERGENLDSNHEFEPGKMALEKTVWLGETQTATELMLTSKYPNKSSNELAILFSLHVESSLSK